MVVMDRREQRRLQTREQLLEAAEKVFSEMGYDQASILDITDAANLSKRTFYLHFTDKETLIEALAHRSFEEVRRGVEAEKDHDYGAPNRDMHCRTVRVIFEYAHRNPKLMEIIFGRNASYRLNAMARQYIATAMEEGLEERCKFLPNAFVKPTILAHAIAGQIFQLMCWWMQNPNPYTPDEMAQMSASILFDGIGKNFEEIVSQEEGV